MIYRINSPYYFLPFKLAFLNHLFEHVVFRFPYLIDLDIWATVRTVDRLIISFNKPIFIVHTSGYKSVPDISQLLLRFIALSRFLQISNTIFVLRCHIPPLFGIKHRKEHYQYQNQYNHSDRNYF